MLEVSQAHYLLQIIHKFKQDLTLLEHEVAATIPRRSKPKMVLIDPETGKPFELKRKTPAPPRRKTRQISNDPQVAEII
jgi:hypothetical protein